MEHQCILGHDANEVKWYLATLPRQPDKSGDLHLLPGQQQVLPSAVNADGLSEQHEARG